MQKLEAWSHFIIWIIGMIASLATLAIWRDETLLFKLGAMLLVGTALGLSHGLIIKLIKRRG